MNRRGILTGMAGILAAAAAPAVLAQGSAMRIWVRPKRALLRVYEDGFDGKLICQDRPLTVAEYLTEQGYLSDPHGQRGFVGVTWYQRSIVENQAKLTGGGTIFSAAHNDPGVWAAP